MIFQTFITLFFALLVSSTPVKDKRQSLARVITKCTEPNTVALTFDDGPWVYLYDVSKALVQYNATGTFFFNGNNYGCIYDPDEAKRVLYAYQKGHMVASHTWSHSDLTTLSWDKIHDEMWKVEQALQRIVGVYPAFMRPPYGNYNDLVRQASAVRGQSLVIWDFDSQDSIGATPAESEQLYDELLAKHPSTILALNHEVYETTAHQVLPYALEKLSKAGYKMVSVAECVGLPPYQSVGSPAVRDVSTHSYKKVNGDRKVINRIDA
ncbi:Peptidoglycan-N-acetylglucosamine deacetylase [Leucoagaricus sp. SymC.cos]|nr:Peptidoglycan-N-acetylglucosamine deacetylase [Leucoagaricus sp. SymC.cos]